MNRLSLALLAGVAVFGALPAAQAADLLINRPSTPGFVDVGGGGGGWDGVYVGAFGGFAWNSFDAAGAPEPIDGSGWLLGVTGGANFTVTPGLVAGIAGDIAWNDVNGEEPGVVSSMDWTGSLRGRLGWDADAILPYVTGGLAFAGGTLAGAGVDATATHIGWTAGAGVEMAVAEQLSVDLQYRYSDYGTEQYTVGGVASATTSSPRTR